MTTNRNNRGAILAALVIMAIFGLGAYFMPSIMLTLGNLSPLVAGLAAILFVAAFFAVFFFRARSGGEDR